MMTESPTRVGMLRLGRTRSYTSIMKIEPERYSTLIKPLSRATLRKAPRQEAMMLRRFLGELVIDVASDLRRFGASVCPESTRVFCFVIPPGAVWGLMLP